VRPPAGTPLEHPLPGTKAPIGLPVPTARSRSAYVVSHHHDGLLHSKVTGLLHPATGQGFVTFPAFRPQRYPKVALEAVGVSRDAVHTLRRVPLINSRTASLRPLPSCRYLINRPVHRPAEAGQIAVRFQPKLGGELNHLPALRGGWESDPFETSHPAPEGTGRPDPGEASCTASEEALRPTPIRDGIVTEARGGT
jgi:hypothetical protein